MIVRWVLLRLRLFATSGRLNHRKAHRDAGCAVRRTTTAAQVRRCQRVYMAASVRVHPSDADKFESVLVVPTTTPPLRTALATSLPGLRPCIRDFTHGSSASRRALTNMPSLVPCTQTYAASLTIASNNVDFSHSSIPAASMPSLTYGGFSNTTSDHQQHLLPRQSQAHFVVSGVQGSANRIEINDFVRQDDQFSLFIQALSQSFKHSAALPWLNNTLSRASK